MLRPAISSLCDPYFINLTLYNWLTHREQLSTHAKKYSFAATYEQFMEIIEKSSDVEQLKQLRYSVITEMAHATAIQHLQQANAHGRVHIPCLYCNRYPSACLMISTCLPLAYLDQEVQGSSKGDLLRSRNLSRYLNQLRVCKSFCEKQIHLHGGPDYKSYAEPDRSEDIPAFEAVIESEQCRAAVFKFLSRSGHENLLKFWVAIENMKNLKKVYEILKM